MYIALCHLVNYIRKLVVETVIDVISCGEELHEVS